MEEPNCNMVMLMEDLVVVVVLVEAVEIIGMTPVGEEEDLTTSVEINKASAALTRPAMVM